MLHSKSNQIKMTTGEKIFSVINYILLIALSIACLYPMLYVIFASVSDSDLMMAHRGLLFYPQGFTWESYRLAFKDPMIFRGYANTLFVVVVGVCLSMLLSILAAFFLSRKDVQWKKPIMILIIFTMFFGGGMVPFYLTVNSYGLTNTLWSLILPSAVNTFNLIILRTAFFGIPDSLEESARLDGAGSWTVLFRICVPLIKPTLAVILLYYAVEKWNSWFHASIFLQDRTLYPLQLVLRGILIQNDTSMMTAADVAVGDTAPVGETIKYAVIVVATLPILCVYPFLQKYFVHGVMVGAVKG